MFYDLGVYGVPRACKEKRRYDAVDAMRGMEHFIREVRFFFCPRRPFLAAGGGPLAPAARSAAGSACGHNEAYSCSRDYQSGMQL